MSTPHTPAPWPKHNSHGASHTEYTEGLNDHKWRIQLSTPRIGGISPDELRAKAHLIAAAPELLQLAKRVECFLSALHDDAIEVFGSADKEPISVVNLRDLAATAIGKATNPSA